MAAQGKPFLPEQKRKKRSLLPFLAASGEEGDKSNSCSHFLLFLRPPGLSSSCARVEKVEEASDFSGHLLLHLVGGLERARGRPLSKKMWGLFMKEVLFRSDTSPEPQNVGVFFAKAPNPVLVTRAEWGTLSDCCRESRPFCPLPAKRIACAFSLDLCAAPRTPPPPPHISCHPLLFSP